MVPELPRRVSEIVIYPFKSARGIAVAEAEVDEVGLAWDRVWMAVDGSGAFISQRTHPRMVLLETRLEEDRLVLRAEGMEELSLPRAVPHEAALVEPRVWFSSRYAVDCGEEPARWMSRFLRCEARVLRAVRPPGAPLLTEEGRVRGSFADASPALVISPASLEALNARLPEPVRMKRFRPNLVVTGFEAFGEDRWGRRRVGDVSTRAGRPCPRCATTLVDQETGERGEEPLRTLATFRRNAAGEVEFGVNIYFEEAGTVRVGDVVEALLEGARRRERLLACNPGGHATAWG